MIIQRNKYTFWNLKSKENYSSYYRLIKKDLTARPPARQRGLPADDGATAGHGVVATEVFRWADNRRESKTNHLLRELRNKKHTLLI